jgi:hypothetical protein
MNIKILIIFWIVWKMICRVFLISESALKQKRNLQLLFDTHIWREIHKQN